MKSHNYLRILILGGYGNAGREIARYLLQEFPRVELIIAGRSLAKASETVRELSIAHGSTANQLFPQQLDAARQHDLIRAFAKVDLVVNAASTIPYTRQIVEALLTTGTDYLDTQLSSPEKWSILRTFQMRLETAGICLITDGGFHPGIPAALARYAAAQMDRIDSAEIFGGLRVDWGKYTFSASTAKELADEFRYFKPLIFREGKWKKLSYRSMPVFDFGSPIGKLPCTAMDLEEMHLLPKLFPSLRKTGFYVSGFNKVVDNWLMPVVYGGIKLFPKAWSMPFVRLFQWGLQFCEPPFGIKLAAVCEGMVGEQAVKMNISISHKDGYVLTAIPVVACIRQWADGKIRRPGLWMQAHIVHPEQFLSDLGRLGLQVTIEKAGHFKIPYAQAG